METREMRYYVAVAEELHFGKAAERLGIAQPALSRAIRQLERRLGVTLMERSSRGVRLTPARSVLLQEAQAVLVAIAAAERRTQRAAQGDASRPTIALAAKAGASTELLAKLLDAYAAEPDAVHVEVNLCGIAEQERLLREGQADVALLHLPYDSTTGLDFEELVTEPQVVLLPAGHPLTTRSSVSRADIANVPDLPLPRLARFDGTYPDGPGPQVRDHAQLMQLIGLGRALWVAPESGGAHHHANVVAVPLDDAEPVTTVIAWPAQSRSRNVASLVRVALRL